MKFLRKINNLYAAGLLGILIYFACVFLPQDIFLKKNEIKENNIYLYFRETKSKAGIISKSYNINNSNFSHVGIGGIIDGKERIYHILFWNDGKKHFSDLRIETSDEFFNPKNDKVISGAIYVVKNIKPNDYEKFVYILDSIKKRNLIFDKKFETLEDERFYCSELVINILKFSKRNIDLKLVKKKLTGIDAIILNRDSISYYPTDIFIKNRNFSIINKW